MKVFGSSETPKFKKIYHRQGCFYTRRIDPNNLIEMTTEQAEDRHFCECAYCGGLRGNVRVSRNEMAFWEQQHHLHFTYDEQTDTLYIRTKIGFWKIYRNEELGKYLLYHLNIFNPQMSFQDAIYGAYHRQRDVSPTESLAKIVQYIAKHEKAKPVMIENYRELPKRTQKQKKYYRQAKNKAKRRELRRLDDLFSQIERERVLS